jgi:hypothetical protein
VQLTGPDERSRHVMPIPMIITRHTSGSCYFHSYIRLGVGNTLEGCASRIGIHSPGVGNTLGGSALNWHSFAPALATRSGAAPRICIPSPQRWQHARGMRLELAFLCLSVSNTLRGCASNLHSFAPVLATRSGAAPRMGIPLPWRWQHARGLHLTTRC